MITVHLPKVVIFGIKDFFIIGLPSDKAKN